MQLSSNGIRPAMLAIVMVLVASAGLSATASTLGNDKHARDAAYLENIITVLRAHVASMRAIIEHDDLKYADNMVRHAAAFKRAIRMVGPMDWHAASAFEKSQRATGPLKLSEKEFEALADDSQQKVEAIGRAANRYLRDKNGERMHSAINNMIESCGACHSNMPGGTVPSVWKGMK